MSTDPGGITSADVIVLEPLSAEQDSRLLEIASKCVSVVPLSSAIGVFSTLRVLGSRFFGLPL
jgi:hypothetical protein